MAAAPATSGAGAAARKGKAKLTGSMGHFQSDHKGGDRQMGVIAEEQKGGDRQMAAMPLYHSNIRSKV